MVRQDDLRIVAANQGARDALQRGPLLDVSLYDLRDPGLEALVAALTQVARGGEPFHDDQVSVVPDWSDPASGIWLDLTVTPWRDADGTVLGAVAAGIDITTAVRAATLERTGAATADRRLARAREVVLRLQGALLPSTVPLLPRVDVAASYLVAGLEQAAGGDWFDSPTLPDGRVSLTVGDVVGHGVEASAIMSQLRAVLAARLLEGAGIPSALEAVEAFAGASRAPSPPPCASPSSIRTRATSSTPRAATPRPWSSARTVHTCCPPPATGRSAPGPAAAC